MNKDQIFNTIKWIIILIIILLLLKECRGIVNEYVNINKPTTKDSIIHTTDTIWAHDTTIVFKPKKVFYPVPADTQWKPIYIDTSMCNRVWIIRDSVADSNVVIKNIAYVQGKLRSLQTAYKLKVPLRIIDSVKIITEIPKLYPPVFQIHVGTSVSSNLLAPEVGVSYKRNTFRIGYNLQNKFPTIGYSYTIFRK